MLLVMTRARGCEGLLLHFGAVRFGALGFCSGCRSPPVPSGSAHSGGDGGNTTMAVCSTASFPSSPSRSRMLLRVLTQAGTGGGGLGGGGACGAGGGAPPGGGGGPRAAGAPRGFGG